MLLLQGVGYPADIIKTRIQANSSSKGIYQTGVELLAEANGNIIRGLYRGFGLKLVRSVPASMIGFTAYEFVAARLR
jgi:solute carrier family 25 carnitine/acylcarnitine transporter 20/29